MDEFFSVKPSTYPEILSADTALVFSRGSKPPVGWCLGEETDTLIRWTRLEEGLDNRNP